MVVVYKNMVGFWRVGTLSDCATLLLHNTTIRLPTPAITYLSTTYALDGMRSKVKHYSRYCVSRAQNVIIFAFVTTREWVRFDTWNIRCTCCIVSFNLDFCRASDIKESTVCQWPLSLCFYIQSSVITVEAFLLTERSDQYRRFNVIGTQPLWYRYM